MLLVNRECLLREVANGSHLGYGGHKDVELKIFGDRKKTASKTSTSSCATAADSPPGAASAQVGGARVVWGGGGGIWVPSSLGSTTLSSEGSGGYPLLLVRFQGAGSSCPGSRGSRRRGGEGCARCLGACSRHKPVGCRGSLCGMAPRPQLQRLWGTSVPITMG